MIVHRVNAAQARARGDPSSPARRVTLELPVIESPKPKISPLPKSSPFLSLSLFAIHRRCHLSSIKHVTCQATLKRTPNTTMNGGARLTKIPPGLFLFYFFSFFFSSSLLDIIHID